MKTVKKSVSRQGFEKPCEVVDSSPKYRTVYQSKEDEWKEVCAAEDALLQERFRKNPKLKRQLADEEKRVSETAAKNEENMRWYRAYIAACGDGAGKSFTTDPLTGGWRRTPAWFAKAVGIFSLRVPNGKQGNSIRLAKQSISTAMAQALSMRDSVFFHELAKAIDGYTKNKGLSHEANVLRLAKELEVYPPSRKQVTTTDFLQRYKERFKLVLDGRQLSRIAKKHDIILLPGKAGRPSKSRTT